MTFAGRSGSASHHIVSLLCLSRRASGSRRGPAGCLLSNYHSIITEKTGPTGRRPAFSRWRGPTGTRDDYGRKAGMGPDLLRLGGHFFPRRGFGTDLVHALAGSPPREVRC